MPGAAAANECEWHSRPVLQDEVLEDLAEAVNYRRWLVDLALPYLGDDPLEVGSGIGLATSEMTGINRNSRFHRIKWWRPSPLVESPLM